MTTCTSCATEFESELASCPECGTPAPVDMGSADPFGDTAAEPAAGAPVAEAAGQPAAAQPAPADMAIPDATPMTGPTAEEKNLAMLSHASAASALIGLPVVGPLVMWLTQKDKGGFVEENAREALNMNISFLIWTIVASISVVVLIGFLLLPIVSIAWIVLVIIGAIKAADGETYKYPLTLRLIK